MAAGTMTIQRGTSTRVAKVQHLFRAHDAPKGLGRAVLEKMLDAAAQDGCEHVILSVLRGNLGLVDWYKTAGFQVWHTTRKGDVWMHHGDGYLDPYIWAEYESGGF